MPNLIEVNLEQKILTYISEKPMKIYGDYRDTITDEQAQLLLNGDFDSFSESWWDSSCYMEYNYDGFWNEWESDFAKAFGYSHFDDIPESIQDFVKENRFIDDADLLETSLKNYDKNIIAMLKHDENEFIIMPSDSDYDSKSYEKDVKFLKENFGLQGPFDNPYESVMTALGNVDFLALYRSNKKPQHVTLEKGKCQTIGYDSSNGAGSCSNDNFALDTPKTFAALFFVDDLKRYGVDSIYGFTGSVWKNELFIS